VTIDVGTGDGRAVLVAAARQPTTLVLGLDANASAMAEASRRAARPARKGGLENARFVLAAAEAAPPELCGVASRVTVLLPWGSLLRGCLGLDDAVTAGVAGLVAHGGALELLLAPQARDGLDGVPTTEAGVVDAAARAFASHGLEVLVGRLAAADEVAASGSTWARRLRRSPVLIRLARR
jgi:16S rRNA (adenine(1408)-N(1))-methyltransferase